MPSLNQVTTKFFIWENYIIIILRSRLPNKVHIIHVSRCGMFHVFITNSLS